MMAATFPSTEFVIRVTCPACKKRTTQFIQDRYTKIWYPIKPYCCMEMEYNDSKEWNNKLDLAIRIELLN